MNKKYLWGVVIFMVLVIGGAVAWGVTSQQAVKNNNQSKAVNASGVDVAPGTNLNGDQIERQEVDLSQEFPESNPQPIEKTPLTTTLAKGAYLKGGELWYADPASNVDERLGDDTGINKIFGWSFDRNKILYGKYNAQSASDVVERFDLFMFDRQQKATVTLAKDIDLTLAQFSRTDNKIFYYDFYNQLGIIDLDADEARSVIATNGDYYREFRLSPDGKYLAYCQPTGSDPVVLDTIIVLHDLTSGGESQVTTEDFRAYPLAFSEDSAKLYYTTDQPATGDERRQSIWVYDLAAKKREQLMSASVASKTFDQAWLVASDQLLVAAIYEQTPLETELYLVKRDGSAVSKYALAGEVLGILPDQQRILITTLDNGTILADLDGKNLGSLPDKYLDQFQQLQYVWE